MDEDECDFQSPVGKIISHINILCKKPQIDNQLGEALDLFINHINDQQKYITNGIFKTNFAEAALFLQSCAELYGKKIDLLWDELISYLSRLVQYDCEHEKEQGKEINQEVITKLEERKNKFKRKRKSKKAEEEAKQNQNVNSNTQLLVQISEQVAEHSNVDVSEITTDTTIEQQNLKLTEIPGWNDIQCLFEQIDDRQLPDKNNLLAILKVCAYGRMKFLQQRNLPLNTPYNINKEEYLTFRNTFFEMAVKKWENVTLETFEDLHKVLMYLAQKEKKRSAQTLTPITINDLPQLPSAVHNNNNERIDQYLDYSNDLFSQLQDNENVNQYLEHSDDDDSLFELSFICDENNKSDKTNLFVHLEQLSSDLINNKLRQDSGFYDFNSDESCHSITTGNFNDLNMQENAVPVTSSTNETIQNLEISPEKSLVQTLLEERTNSVNHISCLEENKENQQPLEGSVNDSIDDSDNRSILSDHDYCGTIITVKPLGERLGKRKNSRHEELIQNIVNHRNCIACKIPKIEKINLKNKKSVGNDQELMPPPPKRRKLTHKQIIKLLEGVVPTVEENHFEKFFNENYRPGQGEGEIHKLNDQPECEEQDKQNCDEDEENESSDSDEENDDDMEGSKEGDLHDHLEDFVQVSENPDPDKNTSTCISDTRRPSTDSLFSAEVEKQPGEALVENNLTTENNNQISETAPEIDECVQRHSDTDDTLSIFSEHSYCQLQETIRNDSGFIDISEIPEEEEEEELEQNIENLFMRIDDIVAEQKEQHSLEEEYQRILQLLEESQKDMIDEQAGRPTEKQRMAQEALELQTRVKEWEDLIVPKLKELNGRDFDIHEYGTKIMDGISVNESKSFSYIVKGMTSAEVTRYFISSLQLANTNNIEICGVKSGEISNDTFEIRLLSRDRYHEHLNDYQAPSKESLRERLDRLRNETTSKKQCSKSNKELADKYQQQSKRRKVEFPIHQTNSNLNNSLINSVNNEPLTSEDTSNGIETNFLFRDTNNNRNRDKEDIVHNIFSKSSLENHRKGKSIIRKSFTSQHVGFEGSQAPQVLSAQITSPRQLNMATSLSNWDQPSTSYENIQGSERFFSEEESLDETVVEKDFQRLVEAQNIYPNCHMQSTPRNDQTVTRNTDYSSRIGPKMLFD